MVRQSNVLVWLAVLVVLIVGLVALAASTVSGLGWGYGMMGGMWGWGVLMMILTAVLLVILVVALGGLAPREIHGTYALPAPPATPAASMEILSARYARGEITQDEYLRLRKDIEGRRQ